MKKIAILSSILTLAAIGATSWQIHLYNQDVAATRSFLEKENFENADLRATVSELQARINLLTNHPAVPAKIKTT